MTVVIFDDTGVNIVETYETLVAQQEALCAGYRHVQMFPAGTPELPLPKGFERVECKRGVFHFNPKWHTADEINLLSQMRRENVLLGLGPFNKDDIMYYVNKGEPPLAIVERTPDGVEVKGAIGVPSTMAIQTSWFKNLQAPGNTVAIEDPVSVLKKRGE